MSQSLKRSKISDANSLKIQIRWLLPSVRTRITSSDDVIVGTDKFILEFEFGQNDYFENEVLTKTYNLQNKIDEEDPLGYEGPEIISCKGCQIKWKKGMNVTEKIVKKRQKHKGSGTGKYCGGTLQGVRYQSEL